MKQNCVLASKKLKIIILQLHANSQFALVELGLSSLRYIHGFKGSSVIIFYQMLKTVCYNLWYKIYN